jgi:hypothetical protein
MDALSSRLLAVAALAALQSGCSDGTDAANATTSTTTITLDTHIDIPLEFASDTVDPATADNQVNLTKMAAGGLDAGFFIVFVGQTARTDVGYAQAQAGRVVADGRERNAGHRFPPQLAGAGRAVSLIRFTGSVLSRRRTRDADTPSGRMRL